MELCDAVEQAECLKNLFPTMNADQQAYIATQFVNYELDPVCQAIQTHFRSFQFVNASVLLDEIDRRSAQQRIAETKRQTRKEHADRQARTVRERGETIESLQRIFGAVSGLPPEERDRLRGEVAERYCEKCGWLAAKLKTADPLTSPMLASLIYAEITGAA